MTTLPNMNLVLPTQGAPGAGVWDDTQDANSALIDVHDHSTGKGVTVKTAGISINADLTFASLYAPINLHRITFASIVALSSNNKSLFVNTADNELYWRSNAGTNVKLTSGSALNVAAFTGGIGGDYASVGAAVAFDDAGDRYTFKQQAPGNWARLASGDVRLFETGTTDSVFVGLAAPSALVGSYTITMPLAAPTTGTRPVQMTTGGVITAGNSDNVQVGGTLGVTGAATLSSTLDVGGILSSTGLIFGQNGVTAAVNTHMTVSGTGEIKHGVREFGVSAMGFVSPAFVLGADLSMDGPATTWNFGAATVGAVTLVADLQMLVGDRITSIVWIFNKGSNAAALTMRLSSVNGTALTKTTRDSLADVTSGAGVVSVTRSGINYTVVTGDNMRLEVLPGNAAHKFSHCQVFYDHP